MNNQYDQAIADFSKAIELDPMDSAAYFNRGNAHDGLGENEKATADFARAEELDVDP